MLSIQIAEYRSFRSEIIELWSKCYGRMLDQRLADWFFDGYLKNFIFLAFDENQKMVGMYCLMEQYSNIGGGPRSFSVTMFVRIQRIRKKAYLSN